jgi:large subunit ribosomal protein L22
MTTAETETPRTEVRAQARFVRTAPRKAGLVVDQIRGRSVPEARTILVFMTRDAARDVKKVLDSAVANAEANHGLVGDDLYVSAAYVGAGPTLKRWRARARGRVGRIRKRTCHITIELALPSGEAIPEPVPQPVPAAPPPEEAPAAEAPAEQADQAAEQEAAAEEKPAEEKPKRGRTPRKKKTEETDEEKGA